MGFGFGPTVVIGFPDHPTLADIAQRDREVAHRRAMDVGGHRLAGQLTVGLAVLAVTAGITAALLAPLVFVLAILLAAMSAYCARIWWIDPPIPAPEPLQIQPYSPVENRLLMARQPWEPFWTYSICPGCGHIDAQPIRPPDDREPGWATVVRHCIVCDREWAQGR
ncbi:hypothetical protein KXD96_22785 [Mycobacterium sp. SMC-2]|uniref:hypothetical protein n=1 Tax=Mycobacterium sp. SMC-2 TaxID=2857058 RepID=UPI0021B3AF54|nr:hypothetical protein [Mycobacterium sp. SMC-2]UXA05703.1 hypothetical protein KXD96_22785 [Mycobacterium sp. SMC-2]